MLKWAVTPRLAGEFYERDGMLNYDGHEGMTLDNLLAQHNLPCLVRLITEDGNDPLDNYCLLLCETDEPYLVVSNETERFAIPNSFDGKSNQHVCPSDQSTSFHTSRPKSILLN